MNNALKTISLWVLLSFIFSILFSLTGERPPKFEKIEYPALVKLVERGEIESVTIHPEGFAKGKLKNGKHFEVIVGSGTEKFLDLLERKKISPSFAAQTKPPLLLTLLFQLLPLILLIGAMYYFMSKAQTGGKLGSFGDSKAKAVVYSGVTFADVAGATEAKQDLKEIVEFLQHPKKFTDIGGRIPRGVLMVGPPGTGKTLLARAVAGEANVPFFFVSGSDFVEMFVGVGAARVRDLFEHAKRRAPCIIFIDEIDAVGRQRGSGMGGGHDEREQTLNQLLVEMDGFQGNQGVIVMAATNRSDVLDAALLRPGRFDRRVVVGNPDVKAREEILKVHTRKVPLDSTVDLSVIARGTPGFSGADLENLVNEAALLSARKDLKVVLMDAFEEAKDKVLMGPERRGLTMSEHERKSTAYHEAGHTLVGKMLSEIDPIHKVTIVPRGEALGVTQTLPTEDSVSLTKTKAVQMMAFLMGGRVAEEVVLNQQTTGAGNDLERATSLARRIVSEWGMGELGPIAAQKSEMSEDLARRVDAEVLSLLQTARNTAEFIIRGNIDKLHALTDALLKEETIDGAKVEAIVNGG